MRCRLLDAVLLVIIVSAMALVLEAHASAATEAPSTSETCELAAMDDLLGVLTMGSPFYQGFVVAEAGTMPEAAGEPTSGLPFFEITNSADDSFYRLYLVYHAKTATWTFDHDSYVHADGARSMALPSDAQASFDVLADHLQGRLTTLACKGLPLDLFPRLPALGVPGATDCNDLCTTLKPWLVSRKTYLLVDRAPLALVDTGDPMVWVITGGAALLVLLFGAWSVTRARRRQGQLHGGWYLYAHGMAGIHFSMVMLAPYLEQQGGIPNAWFMVPLQHLHPALAMSVAVLPFLFVMGSRALLDLLAKRLSRATPFRSPRLRVFYLVAGSVGAFLLFESLGIGHDEFGDGKLWVSLFTLVDTPMINHNETVAHWLPQWLHVHLFQPLHLTFHTANGLLSSLAGVAFLVVLRLRDRLLVEPVERRYSLLFLATCSVQLFFSYVETYPIASVFLFVVLVALERSMVSDGALGADTPPRPRSGIRQLLGSPEVLLSLSFSVAVNFHLMGFCLGPVVLVELVRRLVARAREARRAHEDHASPEGAPARQTWTGVALLLLLTLIASTPAWISLWYVLGGWTFLRGSMLMPVAQGWSSVLSAAHALDVVSVMVWVALPSLLVVPAILATWRDRERRWPVAVELVLMTVPFFLYTVLWDKANSPIQDWDLFAFNGFVYASAVLVWIRPLPPSHPLKRIVVPTAIAVGLVMAVVFVVANHLHSFGIDNQYQPDTIGEYFLEHDEWLREYY